MLFDQEAFDGKVKKAVEAINKLSASMEKTAQEAKELEKKAEEAKLAKEAFKAKLNKPKVNLDPYTSFNYNTPPSYTSSNYWTQLYDSGTAVYATAASPGIKQEFGKNPYTPELDWHELTDQDFCWDLVKTIQTIYTDGHSDAKQALLGKKGKVGECFVFSNIKALGKSDYAKAYIWYEPYANWYKVPYSMVIDHWNDLQNEKLNSYQENSWSSWNQTVAAAPYNPITITNVKKIGFDPAGYVYGQMPEPVEIDYYPYAAAKNVANFKATKVPDEILKDYYQQIVKGVVTQKTKPSKPKEGFIWISSVTDDWNLYHDNKWIGLKSVDKDLCTEVLNELKQPKKKNKVNANTGSGLYFRANCGKWHEINNPEETVVKSINGQHRWFKSSKTAELEYGCGHDFKRIVPVFTEQEKEKVTKEILAKQNGNIDTTYYVQAGTGKNQNWSEIHAKQTVTIGGRAFHHNSGSKTWYMCLTFDEMKFAKMFKNLADLVKAAPWTKDADIIFEDAFPVGKFGFAWFCDGTQPPAKNSAEQQQEMILESVQEIANNLAWQEKNSKASKKSKDLKEPTLSSDYQSDKETIDNYMMAFYHIYDDMYSINQFKSKAISLHKYLVHDIKLASLKKNKQKFQELSEALDTLQEKFIEAEQYYASQNKQQGFYYKPISKVQNMFGYHYENDYGVPSPMINI